MGTSLSFYKGAAFNEHLTEILKKATGLPVTTMSTGVIEGLKAVGAKRVVAATAYDAEVNRRLQTFLKESGFEVLGVKGLGIEKVEDVDRVTQDGLLKFCVGVRETATESKRNSGIVRRPAHAGDSGALGTARSYPRDFEHAACAVGGRSAARFQRARAGLRNTALESLGGI